MPDTGLPPAIPTELQQYDSYVEDPKWQTTFTIAWTSALGAALLVCVPHLVRAIRSGRAFTGFFGISENLDAPAYASIAPATPFPPRKRSQLWRMVSLPRSLLWWSPPGLELNSGQILVVAGYLVLILVCTILRAPLMDNPNRAGFLALAQLPPVFLFATKNSPLSLLLGPGVGYEKLNFIHRWSSRGLVLGAAVHGALWIRNHIQWDLPILGQQKETSGVAALSLLFILTLSSLRPVRTYAYRVFITIHILAFPAFFITLCYHTIYASPWIFPPLAFYGADVLFRMIRARVKDATLHALDSQMTLIRIPACTDGWAAGQHVRLRVFLGARVLASHPLTIISAPPAHTALVDGRAGLLLGARTTGPWTRALNLHAARADAGGAPVHVMIDGPYGGCALDLPSYDRVLLLAGGSGATFALGVLDGLLAAPRVRTRRVALAWCVRSFGALMWFAPMLGDLVRAGAARGVAVRVTVYVTCLCDPDAVPDVPGTEVVVGRPVLRDLMRDFADGEGGGVWDAEKGAGGGEKVRADGAGAGGDVAVCASGPEGLTRDAANAASWLGARRGGVALHVERYTV